MKIKLTFSNIRPDMRNSHIRPDMKKWLSEQLYNMYVFYINFEQYYKILI